MTLLRAEAGAQRQIGRGRGTLRCRDSTPSGSSSSSPSIWQPPQMPEQVAARRPRAARALRSKPCARSQLQVRGRALAARQHDQRRPSRARPDSARSAGARRARARAARKSSWLDMCGSAITAIVAAAPRSGRGAGSARRRGRPSPRAAVRRLAQERHDAQHRHAGARGQHVEPGREQLAVAAELVDDEGRDARALVRLEQLERADQRGEHAAAVDVADEQHRRVGEPRDVHVDDVARAQVDLGRAARALDHDQLVALAQALAARPRRPRRELVRAAAVRRARARGRRRGRSRSAARRWSASGLIRIGFMSTVGEHARGRGLHRLRAADLEPLAADRGVERHVLRLERRDADAVRAK